MIILRTYVGTFCSITPAGIGFSSGHFNDFVLQGITLPGVHVTAAAVTAATRAVTLLHDGTVTATTVGGSSALSLAAGPLTVGAYQLGGGVELFGGKLHQARANSCFA